MSSPETTSVHTPEPARRQASDRDRLATQLAIGVIALGFLLIAGAWFGASGQNAIQAQFPYLLSGGLMGLALVILGGGTLVARDFRRERDEMTAQIDRVAAIVEQAMEAKYGRQIAASTSDGVVVGRTVFHSPDCRLVQGKEDLEIVTRSEAEGRGLSPCRTCEP